MTEYIIKIDENKKDIMGNCPLVEKPQELVRCKDCKYWDADDHDCIIKTGWFACGADWFCADADPKDGE